MCVTVRNGASCYGLLADDMEVTNMNIRSTMDPISWHDVTNLDNAPCLYEGDGENGIEI